MGQEYVSAILLTPDVNAQELWALAGSAGYRIERTFVQRIDSPNPKFFLGEGKVRQAAEHIAACRRQKESGRRAEDRGQRAAGSVQGQAGSGQGTGGRVQGAGGRDGKEERQKGRKAAEDRSNWSKSSAHRTTTAVVVYGEGQKGTEPPSSPAPCPLPAAPCSDCPELALFNGSLKPSQVFHLEKALGVPVYDRVRLILDIFDKRAKSPEARLQVELARLQYNVPLVKEYIHRTRTGEHPGLFFAGGAYQVDEYYDMIKLRMAKIRRELETIRKERAQRRKTRRRGGLALLALAGYTNAGKSALFRALSAEEEAVVGEELFTTLSTTTRRLRYRVLGSKVLLTDTVGFIRDLPVWLVEAFMSTLEEVFLSDAILVLLDLSDEPDEMLSKLETTLSILRKGPGDIPTIVAFTKADLLDSVEIERRITTVLSRHMIPLHCTVSAVTGEGLSELVRLALSSLDDFFFGSISGPVPEMYGLAREEGLSPGTGAGERAVASDVLLRNWQLQRIRQKHPNLDFSKSKLPVE